MIFYCVWIERNQFLSRALTLRFLASLEGKEFLSVGSPTFSAFLNRVMCYRMWIEGKEFLAWADTSPSNILALHGVFPNMDAGEGVPLAWVDTKLS